VKKPLDKTRILHQWNKLRGVPIEWDLNEYKRILAKINQQNLQKSSDKEIEQASSRLRELGRRGTYRNKDLAGCPTLKSLETVLTYRYIAKTRG